MWTIYTMKLIYALCFCLFTPVYTQNPGDPCTNAMLIDEPRRSMNYTVQDVNYDNLICDRTLTFGWYKFIDLTGTSYLHLATSCPKLYSCGTHIPMWLDGTLPAINDGIVTRKICSLDLQGTNCCDESFDIQVKNCNTFVAFQLQPSISCHTAYCTDNPAPCPLDMKPGLQPNCVPAYPKMITNPSLSDPILDPNSFHFTCNINFDPSRRDTGFDVTWLFDGKPDTTVAPMRLTDGVTRAVDLDQMNLGGHLGQDLSCEVRTFFLSTPRDVSPYVNSNPYWVGIRVNETRLEVDENSKAQEVKVISTIPIICPAVSAPSCKLQVYLDVGNNTADIRAAQKCTLDFLPTDWDDTTKQAVTSFRVLATRDLKKDGDKVNVLHFREIQTRDAPDIFNGYQLPYMQVVSKDQKSSVCSLTGDPHIRTLDDYLTGSKSLLDLYLAGEFIAYRSLVRDFEVQLRVWSCGKVTCICGIAAKEGNDPVIIDMCHTNYGESHPRDYYPHPDYLSQGTTVWKDPAGDNYVISFPSGAQITVKNNGGRNLDVHIYAPEDDYPGGVEGICGDFNGDPTDDLKYPGGVSVDSKPEERFQDDNFVESWRITPGDSMFDLREQIPIDPKYDNDLYYCTCDAKNQQYECGADLKNSSPSVKARCPGCTQNAVPHRSMGRRRRDVDNMTDDDDLYPPYIFDYGIGYISAPRASFPTAAGLTLEEVTKMCKDGFAANTILQQCHSTIHIGIDADLDMCIEDMKQLDDVRFIKSAIKNAISGCSNEVLKNISLYDDKGDPPAFMTTDLCPDYDCSSNGQCVAGVCNCSVGFAGDACEINITRAPVLRNIVSTSPQPDSILCDVTVRSCNTIYIHGDNFYDNANLTCKLEVLEFSNISFITGGNWTVTMPGIFKSKYEVGCPLFVPQTIMGFNISVANDGVMYSNMMETLRIDSSCMTCLRNIGYCAMKNLTCLIEGSCYTTGESNPYNSSQFCHPSSCQSSWTEKPLTSTVAPPGGNKKSRPDIWTVTETGCQCGHNHTDYTCACCDDGGCHCPAPYHDQCTLCGNVTHCGTRQPSPEFGVDGYTASFDGCHCVSSKTDTNTTYIECACCQTDVNACRCPIRYRNKCVDCNYMERCGSKSWLFGPPRHINGTVASN